jgi:predicted acylesterase/phospholipase RssA
MLPEEETEPDSEVPSTTIAVTLSGGGVRATFFSFGVLTYLMDSGLNRHVRLISSVSGGSIANLIAALVGDFSNLDPQVFRRHAGRAMSYLAQKGTSYIAPMRGIVFGAIVFAVLAVLILASESTERGDSLLATVAICVVGLEVCLLFYLGLVLRSPEVEQSNQYGIMMEYVFRGDPLFPAPSIADKLSHAAEWMISRESIGPVFFRPPDYATPSSEKIDKYLQDRWARRGTSDCWNILCATELSTGTPVYMCSNWTYSPSYGWSTIGLLTPLKMLYASAAFPGVFAPLRLHTSRLEFRGGRVTASDRPRQIDLVDGGVYNNLGTDFLDFHSDFEDNLRRNISDNEVPQAATSAIVVNSSAPLRLQQISRLPIRKTLAQLSRISAVLYNNTLGPRLLTFGVGDVSRPCAVLDISSSPITLLERLASEATDIVMRKRARDLLTAIRADDPDEQRFWSRTTKSAAGVPTTLLAIGSGPGLELCHLGYVNAAFATYVLYGAIGPHSNLESLIRAVVDPGCVSGLFDILA